MKNKWFKIMVAICVVIVIFLIYIYKQNENIKDMQVSNELQQENTESDLPVMKQYVLQDCYYCNIMKPTLVSLKEKYKGKIEIKEIDVMSEYKEVQRYNISQTPTQLFFDKDGKLLKRNVGYLTEDQLVEIFKSIGVE